MRAEQDDGDGRVIIGGRRIYILPTRYGLMYATLLLLMLLGSLNYDNQPAYLLTFILVGLGLNAMYQTWRNLRGIRLHMLHAEPVFCGHDMTLRLRLDSVDARPRYAIQMQLADSACVDDLPDNSESIVMTLQAASRQRGWYSVPRITLSTRYPLGLFTAWCYAAPKTRILVYPAPADQNMLVRHTLQDGEELASAEHGSDDFVGLREYRPGDPPRHIDWKSYARERGLMSKQFSSPQGTPILIDWHALHSKDVEWKISLLTRAVLDADQAGRRYALQLPGQFIEAASGAAHRHACLQALACFEPDTHA